ncbi:unnamed protein product [Meganyctiphanes norvegica]|uniref:Iron-binding zinc finger CDGSH type domain-containing protein n=1 Tax=Meganyctiphanes norvegica TaxID=48144 RepID=A0AAV2RUZ3_MEGNR
MSFSSNLSSSELVAMLPFGLACVAVGYGLKVLVDSRSGGPKVNPDIRKGEAKVVDTVDIEDIGKKGVFCRCWRSAKFPYCDGSHNKFNDCAGDNTGPLIITKKDE